RQAKPFFYQVKF
ncbi:fumarase family protein, partial [Vibrio parahaemolyticus V-223/04]